MTSLRDEARWIIGEIGEAKRLAKAGGKPQLANSAIEAGRIEEYDADGSLMQIVGEQHDGTHAPVTVNGPVPPEPVAPSITVGASGVEARWSGKFAGDMLSPMDFSHVALHASRVEVFTPSNATQLATITGELGDVATKILDAGEWTFGLVAVSKAGKWSDMSETVTLELPDFVSPADLQDELLGLGSAVDGKITVDIKAPTIEDGEGKPSDALWNELDPVTREQVAVWRWTGTEWEKMPLSETILPKVNIAEGTYGRLRGVQLEGDAIDGMVITGATVQTDHETDKGLKVDTAGMRVYGSEGGEPVTEIRADGGTVYSVTDPLTGDTLAAIDREGGVSGQQLNIAGDPVFLGSPLLGDTVNFQHPSEFETPGLLDVLPRGLLSRAYRNIADRTSLTNEKMEIFELNYVHEPGRAYKITVAPFSAYVGGENAYGYLNVYISTDGTAPQMTDAPVFQQTVRNRNSSEELSTFGGEFYNIGYQPTARVVRIMVTLASEGGTMNFHASSLVSSVRAWVEDMGLSVPDSGTFRNGRMAVGTPSPPPPPPPPPPSEVKENYTQVWKATGYRSFDGTGRYTYADGKNRIYQGDGPYAGMLRSMVTFGNGSKGQTIVQALSGAKINSVKVKMRFDHWWYDAGGTAQIMLHGETDLTSTLPSMSLAATSSKWPKPGTRTVAIPSSRWEGFKTGDWRGIGLGAGSSGLTYYGYARGSSVELEIKYTK